MNIRKMNSNMSNAYIVLRWACHLSKVISPIGMSTNLQLRKFKLSLLDFNFNGCNLKFEFIANTFPPLLHSSNLETTSLKIDEHYHSS
jgi:hypothetical protein